MVAPRARRPCLAHAGLVLEASSLSRPVHLVGGQFKQVPRRDWTHDTFPSMGMDSRLAEAPESDSALRNSCRDVDVAAGYAGIRRRERRGSNHCYRSGHSRSLGGQAYVCARTVYCSWRRGLELGWPPNACVRARLPMPSPPRAGISCGDTSSGSIAATVQCVAND
jgi:hypothetical protein